MHRQYLLFRVVMGIAILLMLPACKGGQASGDVTVAPTTLEPLPEELVVPVEIGGPGDFNLPQPGAYLESLSRYQAELLVQFNGEQAGQPVERTTHVTLAYAGPDAQVTRLEISATHEAPIFLLAGQVAGTHFLQSDSDVPCSSLVDSQDTEPSTFGNPWQELPAVYGAELVGSETLNGFETNHYTFDQRAIRWAADTTAQGDVWVTQDGGFLVRYRLTMQVPLGVLSAVSSGEQTWQFDLTALPEDAVLLPEGCAPVLTDFVLLPDAADTLRMPGFLSYVTSSDQATAMQFYRQELAAAGWEEQDAFNANPERTVLFFVRPILEGETVTMQEIATITLRPATVGFKVEVHLLRTEVLPPAEGG